MLDVKALKAEMVRSGYTQASLADELGITARTFCRRMQSGDFGSKEISVMIDKLKLKDPMSIFFAQEVT